MPRKGPAPRRDLVPDPVHRSVVVTQFVNKILQRGKRALAERIVFRTARPQWTLVTLSYLISGAVIWTIRAVFGEARHHLSIFRTGDESQSFTWMAVSI